MQRSRAPLLAIRQPRAQPLVARRTAEQPVDERAQIKARTPGHNRQLAARRDLRDNLPSQTSEFARGENFIGVYNVDQMVWNSPALGRRQLRRADIEVAVNLQRIAVHHLTVE